MTVLGVVGSPRRNGNTDILVEEVLRGAMDGGLNVEKVFLNDLTIKPCQAICSDFCEKTGICKLEDDMIPLYTKLYESEAIVLGTPVYWAGPSAQLKTFIDRWFAFSHPPYLPKMKGKRVILIAPFEENDASVADPLVEMMIKSLDYLEMELSGKVLVTAGEKGAVKENSEAMKQAYTLGSELKR